MEPTPDNLFCCKNCGTYYRRSSFTDEDSEQLWSDGVRCNEVTVHWVFDPVVRCVNCQQLFMTFYSRVPNKWGFSIPKDIKFHSTPPLSIKDCLEILENEEFIKGLGKTQSYNIEWETGEPVNDESLIRQLGLLSIRMMIWAKLNDKIRYDDSYQFTTEEQSLYQSNLQEMLRIFPDQPLASEYSIWKAEIHRNVGQFLKSFRILLRTKSTRDNRIGIRKLLWQNLLFNRKLVCLSIPRRKKSWIGLRLRELGIG